MSEQVTGLTFKVIIGVLLLLAIITVFGPARSFANSIFGINENVIPDEINYDRENYCQTYDSLDMPKCCTINDIPPVNIYVIGQVDVEICEKCPFLADLDDIQACE